MSALLPLETIAFAREPRRDGSIGREGVLEWIALDALKIDPRYQRAVLDNGKANIRRMIEGFSWALFAPLVVVRRVGGHFAIIDGQHRAIAAKMRGGIARLPCLVLHCTPEEEAKAFAAINGNVTRLTNLQLFRASLAAGDEESRRLGAVIAKAGVSIAPYPKAALGPGETMGLAAIRAALKIYGEEVLVAALRVLMNDGGAGVPADAIQGTASLLASTRGADLPAAEARYGRAVAARGVKKLMELGAQRRIAMGGQRWSNFAAVLKQAGGGVSMAVDSEKLKRMMAGR